jgi:S-adenosylmethionine-dependent methyltransferase
MAAWKEWQDAPWGRLRYRIAQVNLFRYLPDETTLRILDIGGGNGLDSIPLAALGHEITLVDYSAEMLSEACQNAEEMNLSDALTVHHADLSALPTLFPEPAFDVVLCHNVLQYVDDLNLAVQTICDTLQPGGLLSIMSVNRHSSVFRAMLQGGDIAAIEQELDAPTSQASTFEVPVRRFAIEDIVQPLQNAGCMVMGQYGVRCVCDYLPNNEQKSDPAFFAQLERLELALTDRYPYNLLGRFFQIIARKLV